MFNIATLSSRNKILVLEEQMRAKEFTKKAYVASQSLKKSESEDHYKLIVVSSHQSLKPLESEPEVS